MTDAPPLGQRPREPMPGRDSLERPRGPEPKGSQGPGICPDCGLPFGEHPDYHMHDGGRGDARWAEVDLGGQDMDADPLPGQPIDQELGGDPAED